MHPRTLLLLALLAQATPVMAQADPEDARPSAKDDPLLTDRSAEDSLLRRSARGSGSSVILPTRPPGTLQVVPNDRMGQPDLPLADGTAAWADGETLRPEGTFLSAWTGEVVRLKTGGLAFLPNTAEGGTPSPAMPLMPCATYGRLASLLGSDDRGVWISLTGEVFVYRDRNFLLPAMFAGVPANEPDSAHGESAVPTPEGADTRVDELIHELEAQQEERRGIDTTFAQGAEATGEGPRVEGKMLLSRRGRMVRSGDGGWVVAMDNDAAQSGPEGLPERLYLLPCRLVEQMERQAEHAGESWEFEISGGLHRYGERVYLLPRLFVSLPPDDIRPLQ
ncbi:MAG: hypothetical protein IPJ41_06175 [Phycisphaerales bacterium]|nr:hypothetical protein [Phycisphaerales bacterium]